LQAATDLLAPYGYVLLQYDWPDGIFIQENFIHLFPSIASQTYLQRWHVGLKHAEVYYKRYQNDLHYGRNGPDPRKRPAGSVEFLGAMPDFLAHATVRPAKSLEHFLEWMFTTYLHTTNTEVYESIELRFAISGTLARARAVYMVPIIVGLHQFTLHGHSWKRMMPCMLKGQCGFMNGTSPSSSE